MCAPAEQAGDSKAFDPGAVEHPRVRNQPRLGLFIALGAALGVAIGAGAHHIAVGLALGTAFGVAVGAIVDRQRD